MAPWRRPDSGAIDYSPIHISKMVLPYRQLRPTRLDEIKNLHLTESIDTESLSTRGRSVWVHSSQVGKADSKWVYHVVPAYPNASPHQAR